MNLEFTIQNSGQWAKRNTWFSSTEAQGEGALPLILTERALEDIMANTVNQILTVDLSMRIAVAGRVTPKSNREKPNDAMAETVKSEVRFGRCWSHSGDLGIDTASDRCGKKRGKENRTQYTYWKHRLVRGTRLWMTAFPLGVPESMLFVL